MPWSCFQCPDAPCQAACPTEAIVRNEKTGALTVDADLCIACGACVADCPHGNMLLIGGDAAAVKCDLCDGAPECVAVCPQKAITAAGGSPTAAEIDEAVETARRALGFEPVRRAPE